MVQIVRSPTNMPLHGDLNRTPPPPVNTGPPPPVTPASHMSTPQPVVPTKLVTTNSGFAGYNRGDQGWQATTSQPLPGESMLTYAQRVGLSPQEAMNMLTVSMTSGTGSPKDWMSMVNGYMNPKPLYDPRWDMTSAATGGNPAAGPTYSPGKGVGLPDPYSPYFPKTSTPPPYAGGNNTTPPVYTPPASGPVSDPSMTRTPTSYNPNNPWLNNGQRSRGTSQGYQNYGGNDYRYNSGLPTNYRYGR